MMTYIIAVSNEKGGVAKTTSAISIGASLVELGKKVLLIDLDPQANLSLALGFEPGKQEGTIVQVLLESSQLSEVIQETLIPGLSLVPANTGLERAEQVLPLRQNYASVLRNTFTANKPIDYGIVILDCPPSLGTLTLNALTAANLLIIPTQAEYFSAYALRDMMNLVRKVRSSDNPDLAYRILITLLDQRNRAHRDVRDQLERTFGTGLFTNLIEIDTKLRECPILGIPITQYKPHSRSALQYRNLAQELVDYVQQTN